MCPPTPPVHARLPGFAAVIDGLAAGLGIARNQEDALAGLGSIGRRIDAYSGSAHRPGRQDGILEWLAGSNGALRQRVNAQLLDAEAELTDARAIPLFTEATEAEGLKRFIEVWAAPWLAELLAAAREHPDSILGSARHLLEAHAALSTGEEGSYLAIWKAEVKRALPDGISAPEFRSMLARLDQRSRRKPASIEQDLVNLRLELAGAPLSPEALEATLDRVRRLYLAGMATMRLTAMAAPYMPEAELLALVSSRLPTGVQRDEEASWSMQPSRIDRYWDAFDPALTRWQAYARMLDPGGPADPADQRENWDVAGLQRLRSDAQVFDPRGLGLVTIDFLEGRWHLTQGHFDRAEHCLQRVVARAGGQQLGQIAAWAASFLVALRLTGPGPFRFEALSPLIRVRVDNMAQSPELVAASIPTPFSDWSPRPEPSFHDRQVMDCVADFNDLPRPPDGPVLCNPLARFDHELVTLIGQAGRTGASLAAARRSRPAIAGTSVKPYQLLRDHLFYRDALFRLNPVDLPGLDAYAMLPPADQLDLLSFVDPVQFRLDLESHRQGEGHRPDR